MFRGTRLIALIVCELSVAAQLPTVSYGRPATAPLSMTPVTVGVLVRPDAGAKLALDGVVLEIPPGAVAHPVRIKITRIPLTEPLGDSMSNVTSGGMAYRFEPHGAIFSRAVRITIPFEPGFRESETDLSNLFTYFFDQDAGRWERLQRQSLDRNQAAVSSISHHFTDMVNATLTLPQGASPIQFDVNSIKNLQAANPCAGVPLPEGLQTGPFGSAAFGIALRVPPGRGNATPPLSLRYDSNLANGWLGKGFNVEVPAISIDTRFGLPRYNGQDTYILNGEELVPWGTDGPAQRFRSRTEKSFQRVRWFRSGGEDYWEVTDKNGDVREYGKGEAWVGPSRADRSRTFTWYLSRFRDTFGNTVDYAYSYDEPNSCTWLSEIRYSGFEGTTFESGQYLVRFILEDRDDRRIDCRGRFVSRLARRLSRIEVCFQEKVVRSYVLAYTQNEFGQSLLSSFTEKDAGGAVFYAYTFTYHSLPERRDGQGALIGYDAFGEAEQKWETPSNPEFRGLQTSVNTSAGGSLYVGVEISVQFLWWKHVIASFGVRGGLDFSTGFTKEGCFDLNGDGLPDAVGMEGSGLVACLNNGQGFDVVPAFRLPGMVGRMDEESGGSRSVGLSASFGPVSGGITKQASTSEAERSFADVNGDGFLDVVEKGSSNYLLNTGTALVSTPWRFGSPSDPGPVSADPNEDEYQRTYFLQEPLRRWKAYRGGEIDVAQLASLVTPSAIQDEGVALFTHSRDGTTALRLGNANASGSASSHSSINANDKLYFRLSTGNNELGKDTDWNVKISYTGIKLFEDMALSGLFLPPETSQGGLPFSDNRLAPIYTGPGPGGVYSLRPGWTGLEADILRAAYDSLIEHGLFAPRQLDQTHFQTLYAALSSARDLGLFNPYLNDTTSVSHQDLFASSYMFVPETRMFYRVKSDADQYIVERLSRTFSANDLRAMASYRWLDGSLVIPRAEGSVPSHTSRPTANVISPEVLAVSVNVPLGSFVHEKGFLVDRVWASDESADAGVDAGGAPLESFWLRHDQQGQWRLYREDQSGEAEQPSPGLSVMDQGPAMVALFTDRGVRRNFAFSGKTSILLSLPAGLYDGQVTDYVLRNESFSAYGVTRIPEESWQWILAQLSSEEKAFFESCYVLEDALRRLLDTVSADDYAAILKKIHELTHRADTIFSSLPQDPQASRRIVLLTASEYSSLVSAADATLPACFSSFVDGTSTWYFARAELGSEELSVLHEVMKRFRRDVEIFPSYSLDQESGVRRLKSGLTQAEKDSVQQVLSACGLFAWTALTRTITYRADALLPVTPGILPSGAVEERFCPAGSGPLLPGRETGVVSIPVIDGQGRTILRPRYIHVFDSAVDYSDEDLVVAPTAEAQSTSGDVFKGGVFGWFYGIWVGYYPWDEQYLLGKTEPQPQPGQVNPPPHFIPMQPNVDAAGRQAIAEDGPAPTMTVQPDAWVGPVSSYTIPSMDDNGVPLFREFRFAAVIRDDRIHPRRNGGDAYHRIARGGRAWQSGVLDGIRESCSDSTDVNGGVTLRFDSFSLGGNFSSNSGSSWQWRGLIDLNGDRYPDLVSFDPARSGSGTFTVIPGTGQGFGDASTFSSPFTHLACYENRVFGFGAAAGANSGGIDGQTDSTGQQVSSIIKQTDPSLNGSMNGTVGSTCQSEGFLDINGDGLPDHIQRQGSGAFSVALNSGTSAFEGPASWGNGISVPILSGIDELSTTTSGLSHSGTGSFGISLGAGGSIGAVGAGISTGFTGTLNQTWSRLEDMNADGLLDQVVKLKDEPFFRVRFNLGDRFAAEETRLYRPEWDISLEDSLRSAVSTDLGTLSGLLGGLSIPGGLGIPGFPGLPAGLNPFQGAADPLSMADVLDYSTGASFNLGAFLSFELRFVLLAFTITAGVNGSVARTSASLRFMDINGDGLPDHVLKLPQERFLRVKLNAAGKSGLLKSVQLPLGGRYELDYERAGNTVDMPQSRWVFSRLTRDDRLGAVVSDRGAHRYTESFSYADGYYDRHEREFRGFALVRSARADASERQVRYLNRDHHTRGMEWQSLVLGPVPGGPSMALWSQKTRRIQERVVRSSEVAFPAVTEETDRVYEPGADRYCESRKTFDYDEYGNVVSFIDEGDTRISGDELYARIQYADLPGYLKQHPESIQLSDQAGTLLRHRQGEYGSRGELLQLQQFDGLSDSHTWAIGWDRYGNLMELRDPRGCALTWEYDGVVHRYAVRTTSGNVRLGGAQYESGMRWDYRWGVELEKVDVTGERISFSYDSFGRLIEVRSPYDTGGAPAVQYLYHTADFPWYARTLNKVSFDSSDLQTLETVLTIDGIGRCVQTAKQGEIWDAGAHRTGWTLSGAAACDEKARVIAEGQLQFSPGSELPGLAAMFKPTHKTYDVLDRVTGITLPDDAATTVSFLVRDGTPVERTRDPKGNITERTLDARGNTVIVRKLDADERVLTGARYVYDVLGQILDVIDNAGNTVRSSYDLMGRRVRLESPDAGIVEYSYDEAGNLSRKVDSERRRRGESIQYTYDGLNRLVLVDYPRSPDVSYVYGGSGAQDHGAGRIIRRQDESGTVSYRYGKLGETIGVERSITRVTPLANPEAALFSYVYDYLGRIQRITYPDGEQVSYSYDTGGLVVSVEGEHYGRHTKYVQDIGYDHFGQRVYIKYGNGMETRCTYDENRRWLDSINTKDPWARVHQDMRYRFDEVGNVLGVQNDAGGYQTEMSYGYDALYQLTHAQGRTSAQSMGLPSYTSSCTQQFSFDTIGNMTAKRSELRTMPQVDLGAALDYSLDYAYYPGKGHQAERVGQLWYRYDASGNQVEERRGGHGEPSVTEAELSRAGDLRIVNRGFGLTRRQGESGGVYVRYFIWDEENRLKRTVEGKENVDFRYGADGNRAVKYSPSGETLYFDAMWQGCTDYPSLRMSKHVYVGQTRVATRCNITGQVDVGYEELNTYYYHGDHLGSAQLVTDSRGEIYEHLEYMPYGEVWIEQGKDDAGKTPFRFTGKELDAETGLYYYGARYMDPKTARWLSADPALESYLPEAPVSEAARRRNGALPGMGGVFNVVNLAWYAYAANNPVKYVDPTGRDAGDKTIYAITPTASAEISRANMLAESGAAYGNTPGLGGTIEGLDLSTYDCSSAMSAIAQKPYLSTAELSDSSATGLHYDLITPESYSAGDWVVVRYQEAGKTEVLGHAQMKMGDGKYFDSNPFQGPNVSENSVLTYLNDAGATIVSTTYLRPKENQ
jgi:RHS repeat-associated protein